jgi:hypothetical protein
MSFRGLPTQLAQIAFGSGLDQKSDILSSSPPSLDICQNIEFDEVGNARTRKPFALNTLAVIGGGLVTDTGAIRGNPVDNAGELLLFTATALYAWVPEANAWTLRDTYLAVAVDEVDRFGVNGDQTSVDRAELGGVVFFAWVTGTFLYLAAIDKSSGSVVVAPTKADSSGHNSSSCRLVALTTRVLLVMRDTSTQTKVIAIDPSNISAAIASTPTIITGTGPYDVVRIPGQDTAFAVTGTSTTQYELHKITAGLIITRTVKARGGDKMIALDIDPTGSFIQVGRCVSTSAANIVGDLVNANTMADVATGQVIGTRATGSSAAHVTCCYRLVQNSGAYRCYIFWTDPETGTGFSGPSTLTAFNCYQNWADTAGSLGAPTTFIRDLGIASRAFAYGSSVYFVGVFAGVNPLFGGVVFPFASLQNTMFVYRDDGRLIAKTSAGRAGGFITVPCLPSVSLTSGSTTFSLGATVRRIVPLERGNTYSGREPCDVTLTFDDNRARRCARLGKTLYITSGLGLMQYDGTNVSELGTLIYPWDLLNNIAGAGGLLGNGSYSYKVTNKWTNAVGEIDRSTTAVVSSGATGSATGSGGVIVKPLYYTRKPATQITLEVWRTLVNPTADSPFYLVSSQDPTATGTNGYVANDPTVVSVSFSGVNGDILDDATVLTAQANPENGTLLESIAPPAAQIILATDSRLFVAGVAGQPDTVWYSKTRNDGEVAAFNDTLVIQVPIPGGKITALAFINRALVVFRENATYVFVGAGIDNANGGSNYELARVFPNCGAVNAEAVAVLDTGTLFKSNNGWYQLGLDWTLSYIGGPIVTFDTDDVYAIQVLTAQHQIRIVTDRRIILYDTLVKQWGEWTEFATGAAMWNGVHVLVGSATVSLQRTDFVGITYGWDIEFAWWKPNELQGRAIVRLFQLLIEVRAACAVRVRVARNYETNGGGWNYNQDEVMSVTPAAGSPFQFKIAPKLKRGQAFKFRFTALAADGVSAPNADTAKLAGLAISYALEEGLFQGLPAAQKA